MTYRAKCDGRRVQRRMRMLRRRLRVLRSIERMERPFLSPPKTWAERAWHDEVMGASRMLARSLRIRHGFPLRGET